MAQALTRDEVTRSAHRQLEMALACLYQPPTLHLNLNVRKIAYVIRRPLLLRAALILILRMKWLTSLRRAVPYGDRSEESLGLPGRSAERPEVFQLAREFSTLAERGRDDSMPLLARQRSPFPAPHVGQSTAMYSSTTSQCQPSPRSPSCAFTTIPRRRTTMITEAVTKPTMRRASKSRPSTWRRHYISKCN